MKKNTPIPTAPEVTMVPVQKITLDKNQPRKHFDVDAMDELTKSVKQFGILQPIMITPDADYVVMAPKEFAGPGYRIIYGERRFRAACDAGLSHLPCIIKELTDDEILEIQIIENLQRKNINTMEESDAFHQLVSRGICTAEMLSDKLGTSAKYVYDRIILQKVIPAVQDQIREGKLTVSHGKQFARLPKNDQEKLWEHFIDDDDITVDDIKISIKNQFNLKLENAPFDIASKTLVKKAGSCLSCEKRTGCRLVLFDDVQQDDLCLDNECYDKKVQAHIDALIAKFKKEGKEVKLLNGSYSPDNGFQIGKREWVDWEVTNENDKINAIGIIVEAHSWMDHKVGQVVNLFIPEDGEDENESGSAISKKSSKNNVDYDSLFAVELTKLICNAFEMQEKKFPATDLRKYFIDEIENLFWRLDELQEAVLVTLDIEKLKDVDDPDQIDWCPKTTIRAYAEKLDDKRLMQLHNLMEILDDAESFGGGYMDQEDAAKLNESIKPLGIDCIVKAEEFERSNPDCGKLIKE